MSVWTADVQAVLICPKTQASAMYYKTKLQVHNFTCFNLGNKEGYCYPWEEYELPTSSDLPSMKHVLLQHQGVSQDSKSGRPKYVCWCRLIFVWAWSDKNMWFGMLLQFFVLRSCALIQSYLGILCFQKDKE